MYGLLKWKDVFRSQEDFYNNFDTLPIKYQDEIYNMFLSKYEFKEFKKDMPTSIKRDFALTWFVNIDMLNYEIKHLENEFEYRRKNITAQIDNTSTNETETNNTNPDLPDADSSNTEKRSLDHNTNLDSKVESTIGTDLDDLKRFINKSLKPEIEKFVDMFNDHFDMIAYWF